MTLKKFNKVKASFQKLVRNRKASQNRAPPLHSKMFDMNRKCFTGTNMNVPEAETMSKKRVLFVQILI